MVTTCRLGKAVVAVLKHKICVGSPNEKAISSRVQTVKTSWSEAVKALRNVSEKQACWKFLSSELSPHFYSSPFVGYK